MELTIPAVHDAIAAAHPERPAVISGGDAVSWSELVQRCRRFAAFLEASGLGEVTPRGQLEPWQSGQDHVALCLYNSSAYIEAMAGAIRARTVPLNVNYRYTTAELVELLGGARADAIVYDRRLADSVLPALDQLPTLRVRVEVPDPADPSAAPVAGATSHAAIVDGAWDGGEEIGTRGGGPATWSPDDLVGVLTGGTTGRPKAVLWRQADLFVAAMGGRNYRAGGREWSSLEELVEACAKPGARCLPVAPFMHGAGQWMAFQALGNGGTVVIPHDPTAFDPIDVLSTVSSERVDALLVVGDTMARPLAEEVRIGGYDLSSLRVVASGGAPLSAKGRAELESVLPGVKVRNTFGSSESGPQAHATDDDGGEPTFEPGPSTCIVDEDRTRVLGRTEVGVLGWLASRGRVPLGYLDDREGTARTFPVLDGQRVAVSGDRARWLPDGRVLLLGRDSGVINTGGEKVFAEEVEHVLRAHHDVVDAVVVDKPSERWGEEVAAVVAVVGGSATTAEDLRAWCRERLAGYKVPKLVQIVDRVPRGPAGKVDLRAVRAAFADD